MSILASMLQINIITYSLFIIWQKIDEGETPTVSMLYLRIHQTKGSKWVDDKSKAAYVSCFIALYSRLLYFLLCTTNLQTRLF